MTNSQSSSTDTPDISSGHHPHSSSSRDRRSYDEYGPKELRKLLRSATAQLEAEAFRASEAERELQTLTVHLKRVNDARLAALQDAAKAKEELKLYSIQLDAAQEEIYRAQEVLRIVDRQRCQAEKDAASSRSTVRKLYQEISVSAAREEGRRIGLREGLERGRSIGFQEARFIARSEEDAESYDGDDLPDHIGRRRSHFIVSSEDRQPPAQNAHPTPPDFVPIPPPETASRVPDIRPTSYRNASPSVRYSAVPIPPDGYIPPIDADHIIRIPPPHELSRPPPTPERTPSPLPASEDVAQTNGVSQSHRAQKARHQSSPGSNSTSLSQLELVNDPTYGTGRRSPLSVIHEVLSAHTSPNPESIRGSHELKHQSSWGGSSRRSAKAAEATRVPYPAVNDFDRRASEAPHHGVYRRPRTTSSSSDSPSASNPPTTHHRRSISSVYTVPDINIQPPSRPESLRQDSEASVANYFKLADTDKSSKPAPTIPVLPDGPSHEFVPTGGYIPAKPSDIPLPIPPPFQMSRDYTQVHSPGSGLDERPVIPDIDLYGHDSDDDVVSSAMSDALTTPPSRSRRSRVA